MSSSLFKLHEINLIQSDKSSIQINCITSNVFYVEYNAIFMCVKVKCALNLRDNLPAIWWRMFYNFAYISVPWNKFIWESFECETPKCLNVVLFSERCLDIFQVKVQLSDILSDKSNKFEENCQQLSKIHP